MFIFSVLAVPYVLKKYPQVADLQSRSTLDGSKQINSISQIEIVALRC